MKWKGVVNLKSWLICHRLKGSKYTLNRRLDGLQRGGLDVSEKRFISSPAEIRTADLPARKLVTIQTTHSSETFVFTYKNARRHNLQDHARKLFQILNSPIRPIF